MAERGLTLARREPLHRLRRMMAQTMMQSVAGAALSQLAREIDITALSEWRAAQLAGGAPRFSLNDAFMCAVARTLPAHPWLSAELDGQHVNFYAEVNLGMAIAVDDGLIVGVIHHAERLSLAEMAAATQALAAKARSGRVTLDDVSGGTFTVSNLGMMGIDSGFALPRPPESAILLIGRARPQLVLDAGAVQSRLVAMFSLTYDHRLIDGRLVADFMAGLQTVCDTPQACLS
jgi:pyruvate dehydrogenase E2 component (dihydrolipoamide acetyltransferase)